MQKVFGAVVAVLVLFFVTGCDFGSSQPQTGDNNQPLDTLYAYDDFAELCLVGQRCYTIESEGNRAVAMNDLNGDGIWDAVIGTEDGPNKLCLGDQLGGLTCENLNDEITTTTGVVFGDLNGDEHLDLVLSNSTQSQICINNGEASFTCQAISDEETGSRSVALGDLNADGNLDVVFASAGPNLVCINNGVAVFDCQNVSDDNFSNGGVALGDLNGDGVLDAVFASVDQPNQSCIGAGNGQFTCQDLGESAGKSNAVALGDFIEDEQGNDNAPILDMAFAATDGYSICTGNGNGGIASCQSETNNVNNIGIASGDLNGDGELDIILLREKSTTRVCSGDGTGKFNCRTRNFQNANGAYSVAMGRFAPYIESEPD